MTPLSWGAQIAAHAAYVEAHAIAIEAPAPRTQSASGKRRSTVIALRNRQTLLHALRDRKPHPFSDLVAALPGLTRNGIYYLVGTLEDEGLVARTRHDRGNRGYQLKETAP